jgi:mono/diheme cytochrome c family protein
MRKGLIVFAAGAFLGLLIFGCGGKPQGGTTQTPPANVQTPPATGGTTVPKTPDLAAGKKVFETYCVTCHGTSGKGDGPAGKALNPPPRDFTSVKVMAGFTDDQLKEIIKNGKGDMPPWGSTLKDEDITNVLSYIRHFGRVAS